MEGLLVIGAIFFVALPLVSLVMALSANGRLKRLENRIDTLAAKMKGRVIAKDNSQDTLSETIEEPQGLASEEFTPQDLTDEIPSASEKLDNKSLEETVREDLLAAKEANTEDLANVTSQHADTRSDFESKVGGRWSILLGGFALALGLIFMVQYSIEAGILSPGPRMIIGAFFSALLFAGGEWLRRSDKSFNLPVYDTADVPGILTGAGAIGAFAVIYASHALYGFIGPGFAFVGLTLVGIATLLLSSIHGPKLAAIGVLGAYVAPILVDSRDPNPIALALHVITVTAVVMGIARLRQWTWLAIAAAVLSSLWIAIAAITPAPSIGLAGAVMVIAISAIFVVAFGLHQLKESNPDDTKTNWVVNLSFGLLTFGFLVQLIANRELPETSTAVITALIMMGGAVFAPSLATIIIHASIVVLLTLLVSRLDLNILNGLTTVNDLKRGVVPANTTGFIQNAMLLCLPPAMLASWGSWCSANQRPVQSGWLAAAIASLAFFGLLFVYLRLAPFETRPIIGSIGMAIAFLLLFMSEAFGKLTIGNDEAPAPAALLVGTVSCLSLSLAIGLNLGWLPLAFSLTALGTSIVYVMRPFIIIPWLSLASGICAGIALWFNMPLEYPSVSSTLVFNGLILLLGVPALCMICGGELMRFTQQREVDFPANALTAIGLGVFGLFLAVEVVHIVNNGDLVNARQSLAETSGHALAALFMAFGLRRLAKSTGQSIFTYASLTAAAISVAIIALGLLFAFNPLFTNDPVGSGIIINLLLPGYLITGIAAGALALYSRGNAPRWYTLIYAGLSGTLLFAYTSLMLRKSFQGEKLDILRRTSDLEFWLYSPLWLGLGAIILAVGLRYNSQIIRAASGILIMLTILKVFLLDMAQLEGFLKAISFIGLGLSLIVVGRFYQRLLTRASSHQN